MNYYAHSTDSTDLSTYHCLWEHLDQVGRLAEGFAPDGLKGVAAIAGRLHDLGKATPEFQARLTGSTTPVEHSIHGAKVVMDMTRTSKSVFTRMMGEIVAYLIAGHHTGLPDKIKTDDLSTLDERLRKASLQTLYKGWRNHLPLDLTTLVDTNFLKSHVSWTGFNLSMSARMAFSALIHADRTDTRSFYDADGRRINAPLPKLHTVAKKLISRFDRHMEGKNKDGDINTVRNAVLDHVRQQASIIAPGIHRLSAPTGAGKTLLTYIYALTHAQAFKKDRAIFAIPVTSIIDQTASAYREICPRGLVLEHHSNLDETKFAYSEMRAMRDSAETWEAPIIVTTHVQLFESLMTASPTRAIKLHNLANSIVVIDEAQTIPLGLTAPSMRALDYLAKSVNCTIILCTATQPALDQTELQPIEGRIHPASLAIGAELCPALEDVHTIFERCLYRREPGVMPNATLVKALGDVEQGLVIVNSRKHALDLYEEARAQGLDDVHHLSTRQYGKHRKEKLAQIRLALSEGRPCRVIATSLVEAGVDLDFQHVWRAMVGLDQIAQARGRCNREGRRDAAQCMLTVFVPPAEYKTPPDLKRRIVAARKVIRHFPDDFLSLDGIRAYMKELYGLTGANGMGERFVTTYCHVNKRTGETDISFRTTEREYVFIEDRMKTVIVAGDLEAQVALSRLHDPNEKSFGVARALRLFLVQVPKRDFDRLLASGQVSYEAEALRQDLFPVLRDQALYDGDVGLRWEVQPWHLVAGVS